MTTWTEATTQRDSQLDAQAGGNWETHAHLVCKRCHRECNPWPLERAARCAPKSWVRCIAPIEDCEIVVNNKRISQ